MKIQTITLTLVVLLIFSVAYLFYLQSKTPKVAYIRSVYLLENYEGTKEAYEEFQKKAIEWQGNTDTLKSQYQATFMSYRENEATLSKEDKQKVQQDLMQKKANFEKYQQAIQEKSAEEDQKMTEAVFKQIDAYVQVYAKKKGYDLIIGVGTDGNLLYGNDAYDITEEVLIEINKIYAGK